MTKEQLNPQPNEIYCSDIYNPNHPDADWSGFVARRSCRKHIQSQPNQLTPSGDGSNFGPRDDVPTEDWSKPARKIVGHRESGATSVVDIESCDAKNGNDGNDNGNDKERGKSRSSTFSLIGGPVPVNSPSNFSPMCWETEAQAAARKRKTDLQQLTNNGRSIHVRGRKRRTIVPDDEKKQSEYDPMNDEQSSSNMNMNNNSTNYYSDDPSDLIGFRAKFKFTSCTDPSFFKEIGEAVTASMNTSSMSSSASSPSSQSPLAVSISPSKMRGAISTAPYATDGNIPTDPYKSASGERRKDLLLENFSSVVPGYTGKRTFIS